MTSKIIGFFQSIADKADSVLTTKADLATYSTARTRLGVGSNDQVLTADSAQATGLKWATASSGLSSPLTADLVVNDGIKIAYGTGGSDSYMSHDGSNLTIETTTGRLIFNTNASFSISKCLALGRASATISSGTITGTCNTMLVDTEGGASSDSLDSADFTSTTVTGAFFQLGTSNDSRDVTVEDQSVSPYFLMAGDFTLDNQHDTIFFNAQNGITHNNEISRSSNA